MPLYSSSRITRRGLLERTGALVGGSAALASTGGMVAARASASITFDDQESDGQSVVIASARTSVNARLLIVTGRSTVFRQLELDAGAEFTDRTVELTRPLRESQRIRAELRTADGNDELLARDRALIAVDESLESARSTLRMPNGTADLIDADPDAGFYHPYVLYRPQTSPDTARPLYVQTLNVPPSAAVTDRDELRSQVTEQARGYLHVADRLGLPGLVPAFPRTPNDGPSHIQGLSLPSFRSEMFDRYTLEHIATEEFPVRSLERVDRQLLGMIDDAVRRLDDDGYALSDGIHMNGFSGSAQFAARFALLHPGQVRAISIGGNGAYPLPRESLDGTELPYPLGIADYRQLTGRAFETRRWADIDQFVYVGKEDTGEFPISIRYRARATEVFGDNRVEDRLPVTRSVYRDVGAAATFRIYAGVGHEITAEMAADYRQFHRSLLEGEPSPSRTPAGSETQAGSPARTPADNGTQTEPRSRTREGARTATDAASEESPGFGVGAALTGLAGGLYLLARHTTDSND